MIYLPRLDYSLLTVAAVNVLMLWLLDDLFAKHTHSTEIIKTV